MYKGKYSNTGNKPTDIHAPVSDDMDFLDLMAEPSMPQLSDETPISTAAEPVTKGEKPMPSNNIPNDTPAPAVRRKPRSSAAAERKRKQARNTRLFYSIYFACIVLILCVFLLLMTPLHNWLVKYEASQPDAQCQQVYDLLFADPDWGVLYDLAGVQATEFEGKDAFIHYMNVKTAGAKNPELTYSETSAGLSGDHKYLLYLDEEKVASFMLEDITPEGAEYSQWQLGKVELFFSREASATVERLPGYTVFINGVALNDDYTVRTVSTKAEEYLPDGIHGYYREYQYIDGLLIPPQTVEVIDAQGNNVPLIHDPENNLYKLDLGETAVMTPEEEKIVMDAAKANALFAIRAISTGELRKHFDPNTQIYKDICATPTFIQSYASYAFVESVSSVSDYYRYSDNLFSARVKLQLDITRKDGSVKSLEMNTTYFITENSSGTHLVTNITNVELQQIVEQVKLSFEVDGFLLENRFAQVGSASITAPRPVAPEGQVFKGWAMQTTAEDGSITMTIVFVPGENGICPVPANLQLTPMTLHAVFEPEGAPQ